MIPNRFTVYKAGAGSGKTFQIAKRYLKRLILHQNPQIIFRLIGITFTNKAAGEMKKRIIENLIKASKGEISDVMAVVSKELEKEIKKQTGITKSTDYQREIIKRSQQRLQEILHYYDEFQLTTIDKLMYKIIRTFARDMHLSTDVEVEMDVKEVISRLIDNLINKAEPGSLLSRFFIQLASEKIEDENHWDIKKDLLNIEKIIFDDNHFEDLKTLEDKTLDDFIKLQNYLNGEIKKISKQFIAFGNELEQTAGKFIVNMDRSFVPLIRKLRFEHSKIEITATYRMYVEGQKDYCYYTVSKLKQLSPVEQDFLSGQINDSIHNIMIRAVAFIDDHLEYYNLLKAIRNEVNALSIENELQKEISDFKETNNRIFISDFNKLILEQILKDLSGDTPYIYMRLGEKYAYYFIDEFQDTSALQWHNLIPLVREALSKEFAGGYKGDAMIVGDAKQSIYRFRGGKPEQFIALSDPQQQSGVGNPFASITGKTVENLSFNWRSKENIIKFNNDFFKNFVNYLTGPYRQVYTDPSQKVPSGKATGEGYVNFRFLSDGKNSEKKPYEEAVYEAVIQAQENGFRKEEICILINTNDEGKNIAEFLNRKHIDVVSAETLIVANAGKVRFLMSWLNYMQSGNPYDLYNAVRYLAERDGKNKAEWYESLINNKKISKREQIKRFGKIGYIVDYEKLISFNLYDMLVYLIDVFGLSDTTEQAYLQAFLEKVHQFIQRDTPTLKAFLNDWDVISEKFSITAPDKKGAVKIMTVHKAKGLEFPVVIYYNNREVFGSKDKETKVWIPVNPEKFQGFEKLPVKLGVLEQTHIAKYQDIYRQTVAEKTFDNLNRIYVAFTRAIEQLFVITYQPPANPTNFRVSQVFKAYLNTHFATFDGENFEYGIAKRKKEDIARDKKPAEYYPLHYTNWQLKQQKQFLKINTFSFERWSANKKAAIVYGMQLHDILSRITTVKQWQQQKDKLLSGLETGLKTKVESLIEKIIRHPELEAYFSEEYKVLNERDILIPSNEGVFHQKRPDRLLLKDGVITIIDYKTGAELSSHIKQLQTYAGFLRDAGFKIADSLLVYIGENDVRVKTLS